MGLFDRKNNAADNGSSMEKENENTSGKFPIISLVVEEVLSMTSTEVSVIGNVRGGTIRQGDELYLLGRGDKSVKTRALILQDTMMNKMDKAEEGTNVSIVLEGLRAGDAEKYDVLSSMNCMEGEINPEEPCNPFLVALLREAKNLQSDRDFMGRIMETIATKAIFLSPCMHPPGQENDESKIGFAVLKGKDGKNYLSVMTDIYELEQLEGLPEKLVQPLDFPKIVSVFAQIPVDGLLINPKSEGFVLSRPLIEALAQHKRKVDNHLAEEKIEKGSPMMLAIPVEEHKPTELLNALSEYMKTEPRIIRAWYAVMIFPKEDKKNHLVVVDTLEDVPEIYGAIGRAGTPFIGDMKLSMQCSAKFGKNVENMMLFYERNDELKV